MEEEGDSRQVESDDQGPGSSSKDETSHPEPEVEGDADTSKENPEAEEDTTTPDSSKDVLSPDSKREKVRVDCTDVDGEERPDRIIVKRHKSLQMLENLPGKPLVCTACGAYIYVRRSRIEM